MAIKQDELAPQMVGKLARVIIKKKYQTMKVHAEVVGVLTGYSFAAEEKITSIFFKNVGTTTIPDDFDYTIEVLSK
jgi:hypothetical protein